MSAFVCNEGSCDRHLLLLSHGNVLPNVTARHLGHINAGIVHTRGLCRLKLHNRSNYLNTG